MDAKAVAITIAVLALVAFLVWQSVLADRRRIEALAAWATRNGWKFADGKFGAPGLPYALFDRGHSRSSRCYATKSIAATPGLDAALVELFEYHYAITHSNGKYTHTTNYYFVCARTRVACELGRVRIEREGLGDKLLQAVGFDDIDFEDHAFSKRYKVTAADRRHAYELIDGAMMRYLDHADAPAVESNGRELFAHFSGRATHDHYSGMAAFVEGFLAQLPRPLVNAERARLGQAALLEAGNAAPSSREWLERLEGNRIA